MGDGHEVEALSEVRRADPRSAEIDRSAGVTRSFQVKENSVEPPEPSRARNLFANDDWRTTLADEAVPLGPEVPGVVDAATAAGLGERLARTRAAPDVEVVAVTGVAETGGPDGDAAEEVALAGSGDVGGGEICDRSFNDFSGRDQSGRDQVTGPRSCEWIKLVVERGH